MNGSAQSFPGSVLSTVTSLVAQAFGQGGQNGIAAFQTYLANQKTIRVFADNPVGYTSQASTANILLRLTQPKATSDTQKLPGYAFSGAIEVYCAADASDGSAKDKLVALLPQMASSGGAYTLYGASVTFASYDAGSPPSTQATLGFTGGAATDDDYTKGLNVEYFLRLQPYLSGVTEELQLTGKPALALADAPLLGGETFARRAYFQPLPTTPDGKPYQGGSDDQSQIVAYLLNQTQAQQGAIQLVVTTDIRYVTAVKGSAVDCPLGAPAQDRIVTLVAGLLSALKNGTVNGPVVVLNLDDFTQDSLFNFNRVRDILGGGLTNFELTLGDAALKDPNIQARTAYLKKLVGGLNLTSAFTFYPAYPKPNNPPPPLAQVQALVAACPPNGVVFVQLGAPLAPLGGAALPLLNAALAGATLAPVFQNTVAGGMALNLGKPYLQVDPPDDAGTVLYPATTLDAYNGACQPLQAVANGISLSLQEWPTKDSANPAEQINSFLQGNTFASYFTGVSQFYQTAGNDRFDLAATLLNQIISAAVDTIAGVYANYQQAIQSAGSDGAISVPAALNQQGSLYAFLSQLKLAFAASDFTLSNPALDPPSPGGGMATFTLSGTTALFNIGPQLTVAATFTAQEQGLLVLDLTFSSQASWYPTGLPWIGFADPFVGFTVTDGNSGGSGQLTAPATGSFGGTLSSGGVGAILTATLSAASNSVLFQLTPAEGFSPLSLSSVGQLAGGVNLINILPSALRTIAVQDLEFLVNGVGQQGTPLSVGYFSFDLGWGTNGATWSIWPGTPGITVAANDVNVVVNQPGAASSVQASINGSIGVGGGFIDVSASAPDVTVTGQLRDGTTIDLAKFASMFVGQSIDAPAGVVPTITQLAFSAQPSTKSYSLSCQLGFDWELTSILTISGVGVSVTAQNGERTGKLSGDVTLLPKSASPFALLVSATKESEGWVFDGKQVDPNQYLSLQAFIQEYLWSDWNFFDVQLSNLSIELNATTKAYSFAADAKFQFEFAPDLGNLDVSITLSNPPKAGTIEADTEVWSVPLKLGVNLGESGNSYYVTWGALQGTVAQNDQQQWVGTVKLVGQTIGSVVESLISYATQQSFGLGPPWNVLDDIPLDDFALTFNFATKQVAFVVSIGPIDLGFCQISGITVQYQGGSSQPPVNVTLNGTFAWGDVPTWDATDPSQTPTPPGGGNKYFDLRLMMLGQHLQITGEPGFDTVKDAITTLSKLTAEDVPVGSGGKGIVQYNAAYDWLGALDIGLLRQPGSDTDYTIDAQIVFDDPGLYGLRLALAGPSAKFLDGLQFEIMYRAVTATIGVYSADITLPTSMRQLDLGEVSVTLPSIALSVYTNGNFTVDIGFPWNADFSRSFTASAIVPPGIPLLGSAGIYFGYLSGETSTQVPKITNGNFNPVVVFGFGAQVGLGASVQMGIFSAGFSLTIFGILQGVIARFNANDQTSPTQPTQVQDGYYIWIQGTFGIQGKLYGSVDFVIVKASVDIDIIAMAQITFVSYGDIPITVTASVEATASIEINCGLFSITIHFSFSLNVKQTFTIPNSGTPPWTLAESSQANLLFARHARRLRARRPFSPRLIAANAPVNFTWGNLAALPVGQRQALTGALAYALTVVGDGAATPAQQTPAYVTMLAIESVDPTQPPPANLTSFELLAEQIALWVVAAAQPAQSITASAVRNLIISKDDLDGMILALEPSTGPMPIAPTDIDTFMTGQFVMTVSLMNQNSPPNTCPFAMPPAIVLNVPSYNGSQALNYSFAGFNSLTAQQLQQLANYFAQLAVPSGPSADQTPDQIRVRAATPIATASLGTFLFADYFLMIALQMLQGMREGLRNFSYTQPNTMAPDDIVTWVNATGNLLSLPPLNGVSQAFTLTELFEANPDAALADNIAVSIQGARVPAGNAQSFTTIAQSYANAFTPTQLALANATAPVLAAGVPVAYGGKTYSILPGDTLTTLQNHFNLPDLPTLLNNIPTLLTQTAPPFISPVAVVTLEGATAPVGSGQSFTTIAQANGITPTALALANAANPVLAAGVQVTYNQQPYTILKDDTLNTLLTVFAFPTIPALLNAIPALLTQTNPAFIAQGAVLTLPPGLTHTTSGDTLKTVAGRYGLAVTALANATNGTITGLFPQTNPITQQANPLNISHLPQFQVGTLIDEVRATNGLSKISGLIGRNNLHGLRLPTSIVPPPAGVTSPTLGLYALSGQQFPIPPLISQSSFSFSLTCAGNPAWMTFAGGQTLTVTMDPNDVNRVSSLLYYLKGLTNGFEPAGFTWGPTPLYASAPTTWPAVNMTAWLSPVAVALPPGSSPPTGLQELRLWSLPADILNLDGPERAGPPIGVPMLATYDEATGQTVDTPIASYGWATRVAVTVRKVPLSGGAPKAPYTYELGGCNDTDVVLLESLLAGLSAGTTFIGDLTILYRTGAGTGPQGLQGDGNATVTLGILQANLSTTTNPGQLLAGFVAADGSPTNTTTLHQLFGDPEDFVKTLWECSITNSGGFYFYYFSSATNAGLPDNVFDSNGVGQVTLLVSLATTAPANQLPGLVNCLVTGDPFATVGTQVFVQSAPQPTTYAPTLTDMLSSIAFAYYMDPVALAEASGNPALPLRAGVKLTITRGRYLVGLSPQQPSQIAALFPDTTLALIQAANPLITTWPATLPLYTALLLPTMTITVGTSPGGNTLASISAYYGMTVGELAADVQDVVGLFATGQSPLNVPGGPSTRTPAMPPDSVGITASVNVPAPVPSKPNGSQDGSWAGLFIANQFTLLGNAAPGNVWFQPKQKPYVGLPSQPTNDPPAPSAAQLRARRAFRADKRRRPRALAEISTWYYQRTVNFAASATEQITPPAGLQNPWPTPNAANPYAGVGGLAQIALSWLDPFGNYILSPLDQPNLDPNAPLNQAPMPVLFTDPIVALDQWPGIAANYAIVTSGGAPALQLSLAFDPNNYWSTKSGALVDLANHALQTYAKLFLQLTDTLPNGNSVVGLSVSTSLVPGVSLPIASSDVARILTWLFGSGGSSICGYLAAVAANPGTQPPPPATFVPPPVSLSALNPPVTLPLSAGALNPSQLFQLTASFTMTRPTAMVATDFVDEPGYVAAATTLKPMVALGTTTTPGLTAFASALEAALSGPTVQWKLGIGADRTAETAGGDSLRPLWLVRLAPTNVQPNDTIAYTVPGAAAMPSTFAVPPLTSPQFATPTVYPYQTGVGLLTTPENPPYSNVDADVWGRQLLNAVDIFLSPQLMGPAVLLDAYSSPGVKDVTTYVQDIVTAKQTIAAQIAAAVNPIFVSQGGVPPAGNPQAATDLMEQQLLLQLGNAYTIDAVVQYGASVTASINEGSIATSPPNLYGQLTQTGTPVPGVTMSAPKLVLANGSGVAEPLSFIVAVPALTDPKAGQQEGSSIPLSLSYAPAWIEHQIGTVPWATGYKASTWMRFVLPTSLPLTQALGPFNMPILLRAEPTPPSMVSQSAQPKPPSMVGQSGNQANTQGETLQQALLWNYGFTYSEAVHYEQDTAYFTLTFDQPTTRIKQTVGETALFDALAQFMFVYPQVQADLQAYVAPIVPGLGGANIKNATAALKTFEQLITGAANVWSPSAYGPANTPPSFMFSITEGNLNSDPTQPWQVTLNLQNPLPPHTTPSVAIPGYTTVAQSPTPNQYVFQYTDQNGQPLIGLTAETIAQRTVTISGLNVLQEQTAETNAFLQRNVNLVPGLTTANEFLYTTPVVQFATPLRPTLRVDPPGGINIATIDPNNPPPRALNAHLTTLFTALFKDAIPGPQSIGATVSYAYALNQTLTDPAVMPVMPVLLLPPTPFTVDATSAPPLISDLVTQLTTGILAWFNANQPYTFGGQLQFDLRLFSSASLGPSLPPLPLLEIPDLYLNYADVSDLPPSNRRVRTH
jgi:hypothetical protein